MEHEGVSKASSITLDAESEQEEPTAVEKVGSTLNESDDGRCIAHVNCCLISTKERLKCPGIFRFFLYFYAHLQLPASGPSADSRVHVIFPPVPALYIHRARA